MAFVKYKARADAEKAKEALHGYFLEGRTLKVALSLAHV